MANATHAYIGRCPDCNAVPFAMVDYPDDTRRTAKEVAKEIRRGSKVEHVPLDDLRSGAINISRCTCGKGVPR